MDDIRVRIAGHSGIMTLAELDQAMKDHFQGELDAIEERICEVLLVHMHNQNSNKFTYSKSLGKIPVKDAINKYL